MAQNLCGGYFYYVSLLHAQAASCSDCSSKVYVIIYIHTGMVRSLLTQDSSINFVVRGPYLFWSTLQSFSSAAEKVN